MSEPEHRTFKRTARHFYYFDPKVVDLNKLRADAEKYTKGDWYDQEPVSVTIHYHKSTEDCKGNKHEDYEAKEKQDGKESVTD